MARRDALKAVRMASDFAMADAAKAASATGGVMSAKMPK